MAEPIRVLTAIPICDGHDSAINTINLEFIRHGIEVIYLGYHRSARDIVRAAIQEDVRAIGITGPRGSGNTTLIDELVLRFLKKNPRARIAILSHDPSIIGKGALLGDRATMIYSQDDRVFMRSLATRGRAGGLSPESERWLRWLRRSDFDIVFVETVGVGQEAMPFPRGLVDKTIFVMSPDY